MNRQQLLCNISGVLCNVFLRLRNRDFSLFEIRVIVMREHDKLLYDSETMNSSKRDTVGGPFCRDTVDGPFCRDRVGGPFCRDRVGRPFCGDRVGGPFCRDRMDRTYVCYC